MGLGKSRREVKFPRWRELGLETEQNVGIITLNLVRKLGSSSLAVCPLVCVVVVTVLLCCSLGGAHSFIKT